MFHRFCPFGLIMVALAASAQPASAQPASAQSVSDAVVGLLSVRQVDAENSQTSVVLTKTGGATRFSWSDRNRGDYDVGFGTGNDLDGGVTIVSVRDLARDNSTAGDAGGNIGDDLFRDGCRIAPGLEDRLVRVGLRRTERRRDERGCLGRPLPVSRGLRRRAGL